MDEPSYPPATRFDRWHLITGMYPPEAGGVADYTASLARAMVEKGAEVHVWCPGNAAASITQSDGVIVHSVASRFGPVGLGRLDHELRLFAGHRTILIQYVPHAFGWKALNVPFAIWARWRAWRGDDVRVMFHEVAFPWVRRPLHHNVIAAANRVMAAILIRSCSQAYVSIPAWIPLLRKLGGGQIPIVWTPVPSNVLSESPPTDVDRIRTELKGADPTVLVVGHFGTYSAGITRSLAPILHNLLDRRPDVRILLLGAGGDRWRPELVGDRMDQLSRVFAPGSLPATQVAEYLRACDLLIQPYPDGVSSRRGTVMAALANGVPVVTTIGRLSEPIWEDGSVAAVTVNDVDRLADLTAELLDSPNRRAELGLAGQRLYESRFAICHTVAALLNPT